MPFRKPENHQLVWDDLLAGARDASWWKVIKLVYQKSHGISNYEHCLNRNHTDVRTEVFNDKKVRSFIEQESNGKKVVEKVLDEMCHLIDCKNPTRKLKFGGTPFLKLVTKVYSHIYVNNHLLPSNISTQLNNATFKLEYLSLTKDAPVIILPTHKSYIDFLLITYILFDISAPIPIVATGDNFKAMGKTLMNYMRATGGFIVRRNSHNNKDVEASTYYDILRAYVHSVIHGGEHPLEFFMEGTRTRTGQILKPKTGLLSMVVDLYIKNNLDAYILPVSINYQRPVEEQLYIAETDPHIGMKKPKENARNLLTAFDTIMKKRYGKVYIRFTEPIKLSQYYSAWKERNSDLARSDDKDAILHTFTNNLASKVCLDQAYNNVLMPFNLMTLSALHRSFITNKYLCKKSCSSLSCDSSDDLGMKPVALPMKDIMSDFKDIENFLTLTQRQFMPGWKSSCDVFEEFSISRDNILRATEDRKYLEFDAKPNIFFTFLYYSNQVLQMVLPSAICILVADLEQQISLLSAAQIEDYKMIRSLLRFEFLQDDSDLDKEIEEAIQAVRFLQDAASGSKYQAQSIENAQVMIMSHLKYLIECYVFFLNFLISEYEQFVEHKEMRSANFFWQSPQIFDKTKFFAQASSDGTFISKDMLKNMMTMMNEERACKFKTSIRNSPDELHETHFGKLSSLLTKFNMFKERLDAKL